MGKVRRELLKLEDKPPENPVKTMKSEADFEHCSETYTGTLNEERKNQRGVRVLTGFSLPEPFPPEYLARNPPHTPEPLSLPHSVFIIPDVHWDFREFEVL